ncbi:hypothetical protein ACHAWF_006586 [Thalassiosira exigua]
MTPPRIMFDDGSRVMRGGAGGGGARATGGDGAHGLGAGGGGASVPAAPRSSARGPVLLETYYEVDRVASEVVERLDWSERTVRGRLLRRLREERRGDSGGGSPDDRGAGGGAGEEQQEEDDGFLCRVALQFPDELLSDAPEVSWLMEGAVSRAYRERLTLTASYADASSSEEVGQSAGQPTERVSEEEEIEREVELHLARPPLVFVLGDATYGSCCPDEVSADHLNAEAIVHYGHACLSPAESIPVVYAFGVSNFGEEEDGVWRECVEAATRAAEDFEEGQADEEPAEAAVERLYINRTQKRRRKLLIVHELTYHRAMGKLASAFEETGRFEVVVGAIPEQQPCPSRWEGRRKGGGCGKGGDCCDAGSGTAPNNSCCNEANDACCKEAGKCSSGTSCDKVVPCQTLGEAEGATSDASNLHRIPRTMGGLEIPNDLDLAEHVLLYVGDDLNIESHRDGARVLHVLLRCGAPDGPRALWAYSPARRRFASDVLAAPLSPTDSTPISTVLSRILRRRYYLINKARLATTVAVLIGTSSHSRAFRLLLSRTRRRIRATGRTAYAFAVGKLSSAPNKLANFAEIDCFVLLACGESVAKFWRMEREELAVPVLTPLELDVALGYREWDGRYSCDFGDLVRWDEADGKAEDVEDEGGVDASGEAATADESVGSEDDEPFFSMISGRYEQSRSNSASKQNANLEALPGQGKLVEYRSDAAEFLKRREYRGLEADVGGTEAKAAILGKVGIASNYGEDLTK